MIRFILTFLIAMSTTFAYAACDQKVYKLPNEGRLYGLAQYKETIPLQDREVVLTFDDGPAKSTLQLLNILEKECIKATFFVIGSNVKQHPDIVKKIAAAGHNVGNHTYSHKQPFNHLHFETRQNEIRNGLIEIYATGITPKPWFRFPGLGRSEQDERILLKNSISIFSIDIETRDWEHPSQITLLRRIFSQLEQKKKGMIILHDIHESTVRFVPVLIRELTHRGYRIVHIQ